MANTYLILSFAAHNVPMDINASINVGNWNNFEQLLNHQPFKFHSKFTQRE